MSHYFPTPDECGHRTIFGNVGITTFAGDHLQVSIADIPAGGSVPDHAHPNEQLGMIVWGRLQFTIGDETRTLGPGDLYRIPGGVRHSVVALDEPVRALDIFYPIRDEYRGDAR
jgi:quercetin dioxygenase-like cupin family protein